MDVSMFITIKHVKFSDFFENSYYKNQRINVFICFSEFFYYFCRVSAERKNKKELHGSEWWNNPFVTTVNLMFMLSFVCFNVVIL